MRKEVNKFSDDFKLQVVLEYLNTDISQEELKTKYNFGGNNNILRWMRKFGLSKPNEEQIKLHQYMSKEQERSTTERALEEKISKLEDDLKHERLRSKALNTMIDIAERELKVDIRKKSGAKR